MKRSDLLPLTIAALFMCVLSLFAVAFPDSPEMVSLFTELPPGDEGYSYLLTRAPLSFLNTIGLLLHLSGPGGPEAAGLLSLAVFSYCLYLSLCPPDTGTRQILARAMIVCFFLGHPSALRLLAESPVDVFILCALFAFSRGLGEINGKSQGRGILLLAIGSTLLFLAGANGIAFTMALLISAPVFLRSELFRSSLAGGTIILAFPVFGGFIGMTYLSWLFGVPLPRLAFGTPSGEIHHWNALTILPFLVLIVPAVIQSFSRGFAGFLERHGSIVVVPLAFLTVHLLGVSSDPDTFTGFLALGMGLEVMNKKQIRLKNFLFAVVFFGLSWGLPGGPGLSTDFLAAIPLEDLFRAAFLFALLLFFRMYYLQSRAHKPRSRIRYDVMKSLVLIFLTLTSGTVYAGPEILVSPLFTYGNYQRFDEITNLTDSHPDALELSADSEKGYELLSTRKIYASLGAQAVSSVSLSTDTFGYVGIGLYPSYNSYAKQVRRFKDSSALRGFSFDVPRTGDEVSELKTGDAVYWNTQGGLTVTLSVGVGMAGAGPKVSIEGGYSVYVEKKSPDEVYVEVRRLSTKSWGLVAGALISYAEAGKLVEKSRGHSFLIKLSDAEGRSVYNALMKGRVDLAQESPAAQVRTGDVDSLKVLSSAKFAVAVPFIPVLEFKREAGAEVVYEDRSDIWDRNTSVIRALSFKTRTTRIFKKQTTMETAALVSDETVNGVKSSTAQLHWFRKGNRFKLHRLSMALEKLMVQTGMKDELMTEFPSGNQSIGYAKVEFTLSLSPSLEAELTRRAGSEGPRARAKFLQRFWKGPLAFQKLLSYVKACGGSWQLVIAGENVKRLVKRESFDATSSCELSL